MAQALRLNIMNGTAAVLTNESALVAQALVEPAAFAELYDHYFPRIFNYVRYRVQDSNLADDLTALIFERALQHISHYNQEKGTFSVWIFAIARNAISDHLRAQRRHRWFSLDTIWEWASSSPQPDELVIKGETRDELLEALEGLGERERDIIALKYGAQLTNRRIASLTGLSESNVAVILYRSVRRLRDSLDKRGIER
jgi:RNA polymerase sigma factor (sigma-70 family)